MLLQLVENFAYKYNNLLLFILKLAITLTEID